MAQLTFCDPIFPELTPLEKHCGVKPKLDYQKKFGTEIDVRELNNNINIAPVTSDGKHTVLFFPGSYYTCQMLFQDIPSSRNSRNKFMLDFYQLMRVHLYGFSNDHGVRDLEFLLSTAQGGTDANDTFTINPLKKSFRFRMVILHTDNTCQLVVDQGNVQRNRFIPASDVFEDMNNIVDSPIKKNFNKVYDKVQEIGCSECDQEYYLCNLWNINKQWCIKEISNVEDNVFVRFNTGFYWAVTAIDLDEPFRYLLFRNENREGERYRIGPAFEPASFHRGPPGIVLEFTQKYRWISMRLDNALAISDRLDELKRKIEDLDENNKKK